MTGFLIAGGSLALVILRQPMVLMLAFAVICLHQFVARNSSVEFFIQDLWFTVDRDVLLPIPMFILAGNIMSKGVIAQRLINIMIELTANIRGGLAVATILACAVFAAISGSSIVTLAAIGSIMYPALLKEGYSKQLSLGLLCSGGTLGILIPPSIPMMLYGIITDTSIVKLFMGGIGPGILMTAFFVIYCVIVAPISARGNFSLPRLLNALKRGGPAMFLPVLLLGGIYTGYFTATEAAVVSLVYALIVEGLVYRDLTMKGFSEMLGESIRLFGTLLPLLAIAGSFNTILDYEGIPKMMVEWLSQWITNPITAGLTLNIILLIAGCFMDIGSAILILSPLLLPLMQAQGYDPVHVGVITTVNLEIGYITPPVGMNLFVAMSVFRESFSTIVRGALPFVILMLIPLLITTYVPQIVMFFVR
ncbi:TRAP transporter large permease [Ochrobactrum vermis]|uniref:TRAP transporter large permease protein n=1 Tax=Ochrobactrum vermis TaxID=1827297 RepID=A0ABU8PJ92_9HYPH|nr:TRAP transporter large permease [Ochrobactrum vermis]PQZ25871.1 C4-dicarboxylate ABC transporter permease [Ochrobactrum vermis]